MSKMLRPFVDLSSFCGAMSKIESLFLRFQIDFESSEGVTEAGSQVIISTKSQRSSSTSSNYHIIIIHHRHHQICYHHHRHHNQLPPSMYYTICFHVELKVGIEALKSLFSLNPRSGELATAGVLDRFRIMIPRLLLLDVKI